MSKKRSIELQQKQMHLKLFFKVHLLHYQQWQMNIQKNVNVLAYLIINRNSRKLIPTTSLIN